MQICSLTFDLYSKLLSLIFSNQQLQSHTKQQNKHNLLEHQHNNTMPHSKHKEVPTSKWQSAMLQLVLWKVKRFKAQNKFLRFQTGETNQSWTRSMWAWKDHFRCQKWKNNFMQCRTQAFCGPLSAKSGHDYESVCRKLFENSTVLEQGWGGLSCGSQMSTQEKVKKSEI